MNNETRITNMTQAPKAEITFRGEQTVVHTFSGKVDAKGRKMGTLVRTNEVTYAALPEDAPIGSYYRMEPGHYYAVRIQAAKDGVAWGASQPSQFFKTEAERDAAIAKRLAKAAK